MPATVERQRMRRALDLARRGWGRVHPNPLVGAVIERDGVIVGEGFHAEYGGPHAEVVALAQAGDAARGATLYVTLEPCAHHGKTPPCTDAILAAGIRRVVFAAEDPDRLAGGGAALLRARGLHVTGGVEAEPARALNAAFFHVRRTDAPFVALKLAMSLDARLSRRPDAPTAVTGPEASGDVHRLRAGFDAILVGVGTALADDPLLTARGDVRPRVPPVRLVADPNLRLPPAGRLVATARETPVRVLAAESAPADRERALSDAGVRVHRLPAPDGRPGVVPMLDLLWREGVRTILCEGGGRLGAALLAADRVARLVLYVAPVCLGDEGAPAFPGADRTGPLARPGAWRLVETRQLGRDALAVWDRTHDAEA